MVVEAPERASAEFGKNRSTDVEYTRYGDTSTMLNGAVRRSKSGSPRTRCTPRGEFVGVVEMVQDRTERLRHEATRELVESVADGTVSVQETVEEVGDTARRQRERTAELAEWVEDLSSGSVDTERSTEPRGFAND